jgi:hypothetical protein
MIIFGDSNGAAVVHGGTLKQAGSAQSMRPLPSLSIPSLQARGPAAFSNGARVAVGVTVGVFVIVRVLLGVSVTVAVPVAVRVGVIVGDSVGVAVSV